MFESEKINYIQMEKTGCTHIALLLSEAFGGKQIKKHNSLDDYPTNKLVVGSIRNPWDWYVSLWAFATKGEEGIYKNVTRRSLRSALKAYSGTDDPTNFTRWLYEKPIKRGILTGLNSFQGLWFECSKPVDLWLQSYENSHDPDKFRLWLKLIMDERRSRDLGIGYAQNPVSKFSGLMTYRYCRLYIKNFLLESRRNNELKTLNQLLNFDKNLNILDDIIRLETLEVDFLRIAEKAGYSSTDKRIREVLEKPKTNTSERLNTAFYYDKETLELVSRREQFIIDKYAYSPPNIA